MINETVFDSPTIGLDEFETGNRRGDIHLNLEPTAIEGSQPYCSTSASSSVGENLAKHARFNIEKVLSPTQHDHHQNQSTLHDMETIGYATHEAVPLTMFYRNESSNPGISKQRPTLDELHKGLNELDEEIEDPTAPLDQSKQVIEEDVKGAQPSAASLKFGWVKGVLVPCLLNIWGVILYLRLSWLTGQAGILVMTSIVLLSALVTTITTLSMSAICTNGEIKGGGAYYLISRSLGPEFGGSIGIIFSLANAVGVALYVVGFGEAVQEIMARSGVTIVDRLNDIRIIGCIVITLLLAVTLIGLDWVIKTQLILLLTLIISMLVYIIGTFSGSLLTDIDTLRQQGFTSYSKKTFTDNFLPEFRDTSFFEVFAIFFPAATGILAGVNISGDLKDPQRAIPKGTLTAIALTTFVYTGLTWIIGATTVKDALGVTSPTVNRTVVSSNTSISSGLMSRNASGQGQKQNKFGLLNDYQVIERVSLLGPIVLAGIFAATLSSALASLVGSPKTFQAVCRDGIFKGLTFFGKGVGPNEEPRRAYILAFLISTGFILVGELDVIAQIISNFFLMSYALINYSVFAASFGKSPGWRPGFKYYNMWLSLSGCIVCIAIMFLINWWAALVTILMVTGLYKYVDYKKPKINWGSSGQANTYLLALKLAYSLNLTDTHVKNFRPQCLILCGPPSLRPNLVLFVSHLTRHIGLMICGQVDIKMEGVTDRTTEKQEKWLQQMKIKSFVTRTAASSLRVGAQALMQCSGIGKLRPNTVVLGYKHNWKIDESDKINEYVNIIHDSFDAKFNVVILRLPKDSNLGESLDCDYYEDYHLEVGSESNLPQVIMEDVDEAPVSTPIMQRNGRSLTTKLQHRNSQSQKWKKNSQEYKGDATTITTEPKVKGYIDVWWLYDDGGLTMLLPHLLTRNKKWKNCSLRVLTPASDKNLKSNHLRMATLLKKFRIEFSGIVEVQGVNSKPSEKSVINFRNSRIKEELSDQTELDKKTLRQIRLGELIREHSSQAKLVVLTMPIARKGAVSNLLYISWLDVLSDRITAPLMFVRGNQTSVLTFYS